MLSAKSFIILLISIFIFHNNLKCQQPDEIALETTNIIQNIAGHDSIDNKHIGEFLAGKQDAQEYYNNNKAFTISFFTSLLLPPAGLVTTIIISLKKPTIEILDLPNKQLLNNKYYTKGYIHKAKKMKAAKAWGGCAAGLAFFGIGFFMLYGVN